MQELYTLDAYIIQLQSLNIISFICNNINMLNYGDSIYKKNITKHFFDKLTFFCYIVVIRIKFTKQKHITFYSISIC